MGNTAGRWRKVLSSVRSYTDLRTDLIRSVEEALHFVADLSAND